MFLQQCGIPLARVDTTENPADIFTKPMSCARLGAMCERLHVKRGLMNPDEGQICSLEPLEAECNQEENEDESTWLITLVWMCAVVGVWYVSRRVWTFLRGVMSWWRRIPSWSNWRLIAKGSLHTDA